jgi:transposase
MAFLRQEKKGNATYLRIMQSYRDTDGKIKHHLLFNLGNANNYSPESLKRIGQSLYLLGGGTIEELEHRMLHELRRFNYGLPLVVRQLLKVYALDTFFDGVSRNKNLEFNLTESVSLLICERLNDPVSKLSNFKNQIDYIGLSEIALHQIYRTLDHLHDDQEYIKQIIYNKGRNLFNQKLDIVFYDVTTFYFDSDKEDGFREKGFGKDGKIGNTIVTFGLLIDQNKQPVGYEVYHGKQYEGHTLSDAITRLKKQYQIEKVICVADTGMMNKENVMGVEGAEYEYIFGERLRNISEDKQDEILDLTKYESLEIEDESDETIKIQYYITFYKERKLITTYSTKRATKDRAEREEKIEKAKKFLSQPAPLEKKAKNHYLKKVKQCSYTLDIERIKQSERFDGFMSIATNNMLLTVAQILDAYKQLYKIEHCFRSFKTFLETRPMYHWTKTRILGHLALCYISFTVLNYLQLKLKKQGTPQSENQIRKNLVKMQMSLITQNEHEYFLKSKTEEGAKQIMKVISIKEIPDLIQQSMINLYLQKKE